MSDLKPAVTEFDLRADEWKHPSANVEDLEFRDDGKIVRKDRWQTAVHHIASAMGLSSRGGFEIADVVTAVEQMAECKQTDADRYRWLRDQLCKEGTIPVRLINAARSNRCSDSDIDAACDRLMEADIPEGGR